MIPWLCMHLSPTFMNGANCKQDQTCQSGRQERREEGKKACRKAGRQAGRQTDRQTDRADVCREIFADTPGDGTLFAVTPWQGIPQLLLNWARLYVG